MKKSLITKLIFYSKIGQHKQIIGNIAMAVKEETVGEMATIILIWRRICKNWSSMGSQSAYQTRLETNSARLTNCRCIRSTTPLNLQSVAWRVKVTPQTCNTKRHRTAQRNNRYKWSSHSVKNHKRQQSSPYQSPRPLVTFSDFRY